MARYLFRQALLSLAKLFVFLTIMFFFIQVMMPGDFVDQFSLSCNAECRAAMRAQLGLDLPVWQRYLNWLRQLVTLDLGESLSGARMVDVFQAVIPPTLLVFCIGAVLAFLIGLWLGERTAWRGSGLVSRLATLVGIVFFTSFPPLLAWLISYPFGRGRNFVIMGSTFGLREISWRMLSRDAWLDVDLFPSAIVFRMFLTVLISTLVLLAVRALLRRLTGFRVPILLVLLSSAAAAVGTWYLLHIQAPAFDLMRLSWVAIVTFVLLSFGETMLIMQSSMTEVLKDPYIVTAQAKGLPEGEVRRKHAARNALLPVLSRLVISLPYLITGVVIVESSVGWPGMGTAMWNALYWQNMPVVMNMLLLVGILSLAARLMLDVLIAYLDPRIRNQQVSSAM